MSAPSSAQDPSDCARRTTQAKEIQQGVSRGIRRKNSKEEFPVNRAGEIGEQAFATHRAKVEPVLMQRLFFTRQPDDKTLPSSSEQAAPYADLPRELRLLRRLTIQRREPDCPTALTDSLVPNLAK
jgi:hypothetical protein